MTKEEKIKQAWGEFYHKAKDFIDSDGYFDRKKNKKLSYFGNFNVNELQFAETKIRPKSLQGIENNNGWVKIESEEDLPNDSAYYWIITNSNNIHLTEYKVDFKQFFTKDYAYNDYEITHYQQIDKPKPPVY